MWPTHNNATIRKITPSGVVMYSAGSPGISGNADGVGSAARFYYPSGVAADGTGNVYVADAVNNMIRKIAAAAVVSTFAGAASAGSLDGTGSGARFRSPGDVAIDTAGNTYIADVGNHTIRKVTPSGVVSTFAGLAGSPGSTNGTGSAARFNHPTGLAMDGARISMWQTDSTARSVRFPPPAS